MANISASTITSGKLDLARLPDGIGGGALADGDYGDVTVSGTGTTISVKSGVIDTDELANNAVTFAKMDELDAATLIGNPTGGVTEPSQITIGPTFYISGVTLDRAALIGDVTAPNASGTTTIALGAVTLAKMADVATGTVFYRKTAGAGAPEVQTLATLQTDLGVMAHPQIMARGVFGGPF